MILTIISVILIINVTTTIIIVMMILISSILKTPNPQACLALPVRSLWRRRCHEPDIRLQAFECNCRVLHRHVTESWSRQPELFKGPCK